MFTNEDRDNLIEYAKAHFSDLIPYDDPEYESKLQQMAEAYADAEINGIGEKDDDLLVDPFDFDKKISLVDDYDDDELRKNYIKWQTESPNLFSKWFPKIERLRSDALYIPKSFIIYVPEDIMYCFFMEKQGDRERITEWVKDNVMPVIEKEFPEGELFVKNGCFSNKFRFGTSCHIKGTDLENVVNHIIEIQYDSFAYDTCGNMEIVLREYINPSEDTQCIYDGMPFRPEVRIFYDFDKKKVLYAVNYWDWDYCNEIICSKEEDAYVYKSLYSQEDGDVLRLTEKHYRMIEKALETVSLEDKWSVDFILEEDRVVLIDMAVAYQSAYWDPDKIN